METKTIHSEIISEKLVGRWEHACQKLVSLARDIPANKFDYSPVHGTRTPAEVLRHVAFWNLYMAASVRGKKTDDTANELPKSEFATKKQILDALQRSNGDVLNDLREHKSGLSLEITEMLMTFIEHNCEHYGQLVVYARLNGIVPPASRG